MRSAFHEAAFFTAHIAATLSILAVVIVPPALVADWNPIIGVGVMIVWVPFTLILGIRALAAATRRWDPS